MPNPEHTPAKAGRLPERMRILWLNAGLLLPLDKGGKLRTWHLMRHLARRHEITYLSFADPAALPADHDGMRDVCAHLHTVPRRDPAKGSPRFYAEIFNRASEAECAAHEAALVMIDRASNGRTVFRAGSIRGA